MISPFTELDLGHESDHRQSGLSSGLGCGRQSRGLDETVDDESAGDITISDVVDKGSVLVGWSFGQEKKEKENNG